jgi:hypothetical protein
MAESNLNKGVHEALCEIAAAEALTLLDTGTVIS